MKKESSVFSKKIAIIGALSFVIAGLIFLIFSHNYIKYVMEQKIEKELLNDGVVASLMYDAKYPGAYKLAKADDGYLHMYKGEADISQDYSILDSLKETNGYDYSYIYSSLRIHTTLFEGGRRLTGSIVNEDVLGKIVPEQKNLFTKNVKIGTNYYYTYYFVIGGNATDNGILEICAPVSEFEGLYSKIGYISAIICVLFGIFSFFALKYAADRFTKRLSSLNKFIRDIKGGSLTAVMPEDVNSENDELKEIGSSALEMQRSIRNMIEMDALTNLYNRRFANRKMNEIIGRNREKDVPLSVCICDIDHFKKVNDTYGHDAGDVVLTKVAATLKKGMNKYGFAARWGGEEFLLFFDKTDAPEAKEVLEALREEIKALNIKTDTQVIKITMSFGVSALGSTAETLIKNADNALYYSKEHGRNQVTLMDD